MSGKAERIKWLAELSAERRAIRAKGQTARYAIWLQTNGLPKVYFSAARRAENRLSRSSPLINRIAALQGDRCFLCGGQMRERSAPTRDHVVPKAKGGKDGGNILAAHSACNSKKGDRAPYPCELLYLAAVNARLARSLARGTKALAA
jgi:5-methylcytosine-specific restriction endonuclease McrA